MAFPLFPFGATFMLSPKIIFILAFALPTLRRIADVLAGLDANASGSDDRAARIIRTAVAALETWLNEQTDIPLVVPDNMIEALNLANEQIAAEAPKAKGKPKA